MSRSRVIIRVLIVLGMIAVGGKAWAQGRPIEFSTPRDESVTADLHQSTEETPKFVDPFQAPPSPTMPQSSLQGFKMPQSPSDSQMQEMPRPAMSARERDLLEKKKNWAFVDPDDTVSGVSEDDIFNLKGLKAIENPDLNLTPMERYYQKQFEKKKPDPKDARQAKKDNSFLDRDDTLNGDDSRNNLRDNLKNPRNKTAAEAFFGELSGRSQNFSSSTDPFAARKANDDTYSSPNSYQNQDPFSSANYGPDAPVNAQQARMDVYKKLYGLSTDLDAKKPTANLADDSDTKLKPESPFQIFYGAKAPEPVVGSIAPVAPTKPSLEPVAPKPAPVFQKNPLFISPSTALPTRRFQ